MRWAFSAVVAAFVACTASSAAHAQASGGSTDCPGIGGAKLPTKARFDNGAILTAVERNQGKMRHELVSPDRPNVTVVTYYGLFTLMTEVPTSKEEYTYDQDLAQFIPLR